MKRITIFPLALLVMVVCVPAVSQVVVVSQSLWANQTVVNGATYTSADLPIIYTNGPIKEIINCVPDSTRLSWEAIAPGDSNDVKVYYSKTYHGNPAQTYTLIDSIKADELDSYTFYGRNPFLNADKFKIRIIGAASGNGGAKLWLRYERWFKLP